MILSLFRGLGAKLWILGGGILSILAMVARMQSLKTARDAARDKAATLEATIHTEQEKQKVIKEEVKKLSIKKAEIKEEIKKIKKGESVEGIDNLSNPNDY